MQLDDSPAASPNPSPVGAVHSHFDILFTLGYFALALSFQTTLLGSEFPVPLTLYPQGERLTRSTLGSVLEAGVGLFFLLFKGKKAKKHHYGSCGMLLWKHPGLSGPGQE